MFKPTLLDICPEETAPATHPQVNFSFSQGWAAGAAGAKKCNYLYYRKRDLPKILQMTQPG